MQPADQPVAPPGTSAGQNGRALAPAHGGAAFSPPQEKAIKGASRNQHEHPGTGVSKTAAPAPTQFASGARGEEKMNGDAEKSENAVGGSPLAADSDEGNASADPPQGKADEQSALQAGSSEPASSSPSPASPPPPYDSSATQPVAVPVSFQAPTLPQQQSPGQFHLSQSPGLHPGFYQGPSHLHSGPTPAPGALQFVPFQGAPPPPGLQHHQHAPPPGFSVPQPHANQSQAMFANQPGAAPAGQMFYAGSPPNPGWQQMQVPLPEVQQGFFMPAPMAQHPQQHQHQHQHHYPQHYPQQHEAPMFAPHAQGSPQSRGGTPPACITTAHYSPVTPHAAAMATAAGLTASPSSPQVSTNPMAAAVAVSPPEFIRSVDVASFAHGVLITASRIVCKKMLPHLQSAVRDASRRSGATIEVQEGTDTLTFVLRGDFAQVHHCSVLLQLRIGPRDINVACLTQMLEQLPHPAITVPVPMEHVGRVIGKSGQTIRQLHEWTGANIDLPKECVQGTKMRRVTISGLASQVAQCHALIIAKITPTAEGGNAGPNSAFTMPLHDPNGLRVLVRDELVGRVIGKKGAHIRELQNESGATVFLPKECVPGTRSREVVLSGSQEQVTLCYHLLVAKLAPTDEERQAGMEPPQGWTYVTDASGQLSGVGGYAGGYAAPTDQAFGEGRPAATTTQMSMFLTAQQYPRFLNCYEHVQLTTGAAVEAKNTAAHGHVEVVITGPPPQVSACSKMLQQLVLG
eukprot:m.478705 g.478705  ORF g.478705 m.478705 type:complete len:743 (+) comp21204_c0_seq1:177-2405(+)